MITVIYAKVGSDSFTQIIQHEFDDVKIPTEKPIYEDVEKEIVNDENGEIEKITTQELVKTETIYETPVWWHEPEKINIPSDCVIMSEVRPDINYIASDNNDGTGTWIIDEKYWEKKNQSMINDLKLEASQQIEILQDAIELDITEKGDEDKLKAWKKYRVLLNRVDACVEDMELPEKPNA